MRRFCVGVGVLSISCLHPGCDGGSGVSTATPENPQPALDALEKLVPPNAMKKAVEATRKAKHAAPASGAGKDK